jgi:hypothetical protein
MQRASYSTAIILDARKCPCVRQPESEVLFPWGLVPMPLCKACWFARLERFKVLGKSNSQQLQGTCGVNRAWKRRHCRNVSTQGWRKVGVQQQRSWRHEPAVLTQRHHWRVIAA